MHRMRPNSEAPENCLAMDQKRSHDVSCITDLQLRMAWDLPRPCPVSQIEINTRGPGETGDKHRRGQQIAVEKLSALLRRCKQCKRFISKALHRISVHAGSKVRRVSTGVMTEQGDGRSKSNCPKNIADDDSGAALCCHASLSHPRAGSVAQPHLQVYKRVGMWLGYTPVEMREATVD